MDDLPEDKRKGSRRLTPEQANTLFESLPLNEQDILLKNYRYYQLTLDQAGRMCSRASLKKNRNSIVARAFNKLANLELVERLEVCPEGSKKKRLYFRLTSDGIAVCSLILGKSDRRRYKKKLDKLTISENTRHQEAIIDVVAAFNDKRDSHESGLEVWINDGDVEFDFTYWSSKHNRIRPDGYGILVPNLGESYPFLLEVQRTVGDYEEICDKAKKYWRFIESGEYAKPTNLGQLKIPLFLYVVGNQRIGSVVDQQIRRGIALDNTTYEYAGSWIVFAVALLSDIRDPDKGPFAPIWNPVFQPRSRLTFKDLCWYVRIPPKLPLHKNDLR